jgi:hypothetical protein
LGKRPSTSLEDDLVLERRDLDPVAAFGARDARELLERARRHVGLERSLERLIERRLLHAQPV